MRTKSAQATAVLANPAHTARAIVTVYDADDNATTFESGELLGITEPTLSVEVKQDVDSFRTATVTLLRQQGRYSLSPLVTTGNPLDPLVNVGWRIVIETELLPPDVGAGVIAGLRETIFDGFIDEMRWPGDDLELVCTDKSAEPRDRWIERERFYGAATGAYATKGCYLWDYTMPALVVGDLVMPSETNLNGHFYRVTAATSPQTVAEPTWPTGSGSTVVSGGVTLTESGVTSETGVAVEELIQQILDDNGLSNIVLDCPTSPSWNIRPYLQKRETVMGAIKALVEQLGWWLRFEWSSTSSAYVLRLAEPDRASTTVHKVLTEDDEVDCTELGIDVWSIRNVVRVVYGDSSSRSPTGGPTRIALEVSDATSIAQYGRRFMEVAEDDASAIDTAAEATRLANAILSDLAQPLIGVGLSFSLDPYLELGDRITIPADGLRWSAAQTLAVQSLSHVIDGAGARTTVTMRGAPAAAHNGWLDMEGRINRADVHRLTMANSVSLTTTVAPSVGGTRFTAARSLNKSALNTAMELHVSPTTGFAPSASTLLAAGEADTFESGSLVPGKTYYGRWVPFARNASRVVRGIPSAEFSFVAGRASAGHLDSLITSIAAGPPNGKFQTAFDSLSSSPPDHWTVTAGEWGSSKDIYHGSTTTHGRHIEFRQTAVVGVLRSAAWPIAYDLSLAKLKAAVRPRGTLSAGRDLKIQLEFFSDESLATSLGSNIVEVPWDIAADNVWAHSLHDVTIPAGANYARIEVFKAAASSAYGFDIASIDFIPSSPTAVEAWTAPTLNTGWAAYPGGAFHEPGYMKDLMGFVHLRGLAQRTSGTNGTLFTLPAGYRPTKIVILPGYVDGNFGDTDVVRVNSAGDVYLTFNAAGNKDVGLDGLYFDTR